MTPEKLTERLLKKCEVAGITKVAIGVRHKSIGRSMAWLFFSVNDCVFTNKPSRVHDWPPIWGILEELGIGFGAGNGDQHQADTDKLVKGVYHLKNHVWEKIDD